MTTTRFPIVSEWPSVIQLSDLDGKKGLPEHPLEIVFLKTIEDTLGYNNSIK